MCARDCKDQPLGISGISAYRHNAVTMNNQCARGTTASVVRNDIKVIDAIILNPEAVRINFNSAHFC